MTTILHALEVKVVAPGKVTAFPSDRHAFGQLVYPLTGVIELVVGLTLYTAPPDYGIWLPPEVDHEAWANHESKYVVVNIPMALCRPLPPLECVLSVSAIARAILADAERQGTLDGQTDESVRLMRVLVDQLGHGSDLKTHFPLSEDRVLKPILTGLQGNPGNRRSLSQWAETVGSTERTLARKFKRDLGVTFAEWRQKLRVSRALGMLAEGTTIQNISHDLGYGSASAFIRMFKDTTGVTPNHFRRKTAEPD